MISKLNISLGIAIIALILAGWVFVSEVSADKRKIAFANTSKLMYEYRGMKEAHNIYQGKMQAMNANLDSLKADFNRTLQAFQTNLSNMNDEEKRTHQLMLQKMEQNVLAYSKTVQERGKLEDEKLTEGVINQVNSFVKEYGERNGYDVILGSTDGGNVLYGEQALDITKELVTALNNEYTGN